MTKFWRHDKLVKVFSSFNWKCWILSLHSCGRLNQVDYNTKFWNRCRNVCTKLSLHSASDLQQCLFDTWAHITKEHGRSCWSTVKAGKWVRDDETHLAKHLLNWTVFKAIIRHN